MRPASAPQPPPAPTTAPATASSGPAPPSAARTLLEPSHPTDARPLPAPAACGSFTSYGSGAQPGLPGAPLPPRFAWASRSLASSCLGLSASRALGHQEGCSSMSLGPRQPPLPHLLGSAASEPGPCTLPLSPLGGRGLPLPLLTPWLCFLSPQPSLLWPRKPGRTWGRG
jgi:hypothetical protein